MEAAERRASNDAAEGVDAARRARSTARGEQQRFVAYAGNLVATGSAMLQVIFAVLLLTRLGIPAAVQSTLGSISCLQLLAASATVGLGSRWTIARYQVYCTYIIREKIKKLVSAGHWYSLVIDEATPSVRAPDQSDWKAGRRRRHGGRRRRRVRPSHWCRRGGTCDGELRSATS